MDETYADRSLSLSHRAIALTGLLVSADGHRDLKEKYYASIAQVVGRVPNVVPAISEIHAARLLPGADDDARITFLNCIVDLILDRQLSIYRVGYFQSKKMMDTFGSERSIVGLCFFSMLQMLETALSECAIWPVMEADHSKEQDQAFAGQVQFADHLASHIGAAALSRDQMNLGEVLYSTKRSIYGAMVDCVAYLLNVKWVADQGLALSPYKRRLLKVAERLSPTVMHDEIIRMKFE
ncbi:hypothetical protein [Bosea sp. (in: a-proteobacteria)]|jgi:hypothetical protein|uniref:hypothetical protein n=1 Tax=Bosea sp. (in: a-proteobacteria) TaxID=1871050 RepID=UPI00356204FA